MNSRGGLVLCKEYIYVPLIDWLMKVGNVTQDYHLA